MNISVDITYSPLQDDFEEHIIAFIQNLRASGLKVIENPLATQVYGSYDTVLQVLHEEMKKSFETIGIGLFTLKVVKADRSDYEPFF